jgi:sugar phosphate isomerase/epimerase
MVGLAAFPKCFFDDLLVHKSMTLFEWIELARQLNVDGLEMYSPFFEGRDDAYVGQVRETCDRYGLALPMMCFSPDFTHPDPGKRSEELARQKSAIDLTVKLGGKYCLTRQHLQCLFPFFGF